MTQGQWLKLIKLRMFNRFDDAYCNGLKQNLMMISDGQLRLKSLNQVLANYARGLFLFDLS